MTGKLDRKLSAYELVGQLIGICFRHIPTQFYYAVRDQWRGFRPCTHQLQEGSCTVGICAASHLLRNQTAVGRVDNAGSVRIFDKGYSTSCKLSNTLVKTIHQVTMGLNIHYFRCTTDGAIAADAISKANWCRLKRYMPEHTERPTKIPVALMDWIHRPCEDFLLGQKNLREIATKCLIMNYNC